MDQNSKKEDGLEGVEVFNSGKRTLRYDGGSLPPGKHPIPKKIADKLIKMYPKEISFLQNIAFVDTSKNALAAEKEAHLNTQVKLETSEKENIALKDELLTLRTENNRLRKIASEAAASAESDKKKKNR
jgi:hypothetical protein